MKPPVAIMIVAIALSMTGCMFAGEMGNGYFSYECTGLPDAYCNQFPLFGSFPDEIAVGSTFRVDFSGSTLNTHLIPASPEIIRLQSDGAFRMLREGESAILARNEQGLVYDFFHLNGAEIDAIELEVLTINYPQNTLDDAITLPAGDSLRVRALPLSILGSTLAGGLNLETSSSDEDTVTIEEPLSNQQNQLEFRALMPGQAVIEIMMGGVLRMLDITVEEGGA